jgi:hypothetical protein
MEALTTIPFELDSDALMGRVHIKPDSEDVEAFEGLVKLAREVARPKALFMEAFIDVKGEDTVLVEGVTLTSRLLRLNLDTVERIFPFVATCGHEMDEVELPDEFMASYWWDEIKAVVLGSARMYLGDWLNQKYLLGKVSSMSPGSGDVEIWPVSQQKELFALLNDVTPHIGVRLTDSMLMIPNKSVSGIVFPTEVDYRGCQVCHRQNCPNRSAPFDEDLWRSTQH